MNQRILNLPEHPAVHATSLDELPAVAQGYLVFQAVMTAFGFPSEAIRYAVAPARSSGRDASNLAATVEIEGRRLAYELGPTVPQVDGWLKHAAELWRAADQTTRHALYLASPLLEGARFSELLRAITSAGLHPPIPVGLWYSRLESSGIADAIRRSASFPAVASQVSGASDAAPRSRAVSPSPVSAVGPPRFALGELAYMNEDSAQLPRAELDVLLRRHASGDWGDTLYRADNETALQTGRAVMSALRTTSGQRLWLITWASRTRTVVWLQSWPDFPEEALLDLVCRYVGTGRRDKLRVSPQDVLFSLPLVGDLGPADGYQLEIAALLLGAIITQDGEHVIPYRPEQMVRALWRAVEGVDLRPIDRKDRRVGLGASDRVWTAAKSRCNDRQIFAWFAASWEDRSA